eukprot:scaffold200628_cov35-Tisochrysis_lutea.AAC.3
MKICPSSVMPQISCTRACKSNTLMGQNSMYMRVSSRNPRISRIKYGDALGLRAVEIWPYTDEHK